MKVSRRLLALTCMPLLASAAVTSDERRLRGVWSRENKDVPSDERILGDKAGLEEIDVGEAIGIGCFSASSMVQVEDKGLVPMKDLQVGDMILTACNGYQSVYTFGHYLPNQEATFVQLHTDQGATLKVTPEHLIFDEDNHAVRADSLQVGDRLQASTQQEQQHTITKIGTIQRKGLYAPFTASGTLVVDGIVASSYISLQDGHNDIELSNGFEMGISQHDYLHIGMSPLRLLCLGVSSHYCKTENYTSEGMPGYAALGVWIHQWVNQQGSIIQFLNYSVIGLLTAICFAAENIFGAAKAPFALLVLVLAGWIVARRAQALRA